ncbi:hypothetical protein [Stenotrophomonas rhizophila]|uniref:hypothetical protein n=1 Tax=Stenotrophomonas rhizophila TaxID=216778 RepID=UPI00163A1717|nr:hypothetical protein [Stenotrophomonas rhizophila]
MSAYLAGPCLGRRLARLYVGLLACLPLPALASDFTGLLTGMTLLLLAATLVMLLPLLLVRRHAWVRWLGTFVGVGVLLIGLGTAGVDTWRLVARTEANDVLSVGTGLLLYLLLWLAIAYTTYRLQRRPPGPGTRGR